VANRFAAQASVFSAEVLDLLYEKIRNIVSDLIPGGKRSQREIARTGQVRVEDIWLPSPLPVMTCCMVGMAPVRVRQAERERTST
jgi:hypothetical protein